MINKGLDLINKLKCEHDYELLEIVNDNYKIIQCTKCGVKKKIRRNSFDEAYDILLDCIEEDKSFKWDYTFVKSLELYEEHSKCAAKQVACILVKNNNILSIGLNGTLKGKINCNEKFKKINNKWYRYESTIEGIKIKNTLVECDTNPHSEWSKLNEVHAEMNAIKKATSDGHFDLNGATAYISYSPCFNCAKMLVLFGIERIVFKNKYDDWNEVKLFLDENGIKYEHIEL